MLDAFVALFLVLHFRKTLKVKAPGSYWFRMFNSTAYAIVILLVLQEVLRISSITMWIWHVLVLLLIIVLLRNPEFKNDRSIALAVLPLVLISFLQDILKVWPNKFADKLANYLDYAFPFAIIWLVTLWIIFRRQQKALEKERKIREEEEREARIVAARKTELEILVNERTAEITRQKEELQHALDDLKATQAQLIQSEKMASLGELTAGIAHEIQNPLNFVNNFSDVSGELLEEMKAELEKGDYNEAIAIAEEVKQNLDKILFHGKRADAIVKGMLQHSRTSSGQKEPTDINALCDEYLRLSYHGLRAKDKTFNAKFETDFDQSLGVIRIIPQDIGRVILNLINNAFYAVNARQKQHVPGYEPTVIIKTSNATATGNRGNIVEIRVIDNGTGIPQSVRDKIFQPFFTTKPTGEGTGLGLSLSYDIINKGHNGELLLESKEGEGTTFIIKLPAD